MNKSGFKVISMAREQYEFINNVASPLCNIDRDIPQGWILGLLLFCDFH